MAIIFTLPSCYKICVSLFINIYPVHGNGKEAIIILLSVAVMFCMFANEPKVLYYDCLELQHWFTVI